MVRSTWGRRTWNTAYFLIVRLLDIVKYVDDDKEEDDEEGHSAWDDDRVDDEADPGDCHE